MGEWIRLFAGEIPFVKTLPGGGVESGESMQAAAVREVVEEAGARCIPIRHLGLFIVSDNVG